MMDVNGAYEMKKQQYQDRLREAEAYRFARELGLTEAGTFRSFVTKLGAWQSQITSQKVTSSDETRVPTTRVGN